MVSGNDKEMLSSVSDIDLRLLRVFMTVVHCRGFAASEEALNVSQANISMQMKQLEDRLGVCLCHRGRSGFWVTDEGKEVYEACETLFHSIDNFRSTVSHSLGKLAKRLHISVVNNIVFNESFQLHKTIRDFKEKEHNSELMLNITSSSEVEKMVSNGLSDIGIGQFLSHRDDLEYKPLFTSAMNLYCGRGHPLFERAPDELTIQEVLDHGDALVTDHSLFKKKSLDSTSSSTVESLLVLILSGKYMAYLPDRYAHNWVMNDDIRPLLPETTGYRALYELITQKGQIKNKLLDSFIENLGLTFCNMVGYSSSSNEPINLSKRLKLK